MCKQSSKLVELRANSSGYQIIYKKKFHLRLAGKTLSRKDVDIFNPYYILREFRKKEINVVHVKSMAGRSTLEGIPVRVSKAVDIYVPFFSEKNKK